MITERDSLHSQKLYGGAPNDRNFQTRSIRRWQPFPNTNTLYSKIPKDKNKISRENENGKSFIKVVQVFQLDQYNMEELFAQGGQ